MDVAQIRNFKDFLVLYNQISDTCFRRCTNTFNSRNIESDEEACINNCAQKHINANHRIMEVYMEVQPVLVNRRIEELNATQVAVETQQQPDIQHDTAIVEMNQNLLKPEENN